MSFSFCNSSKDFIRFLLGLEIKMESESRYKQVTEPHYECVIFDVDDTLYPFSSGISAECTKNINEYMINTLGIEKDKVADMCSQLYKDYGTTMAGLRAIGYEFDYDDYHSYVHGRLPYELLKPDHVLSSILHSLPIRKIIFSNANEAHVAKVLSRLGLEDCFDDVICFETLNPIHNSSISKEEGEVLKTTVVCKPFEEAFEQAFKIAEVNPQKALFFDDSIRNIQTGKQMGLHTVWVGSSRRTDGLDYALKSIHNIREALPELWEAVQKSAVRYPEENAVETIVRA